MQLQACDLGFCGVLEGWTREFPSIAGDGVNLLVSGLRLAEGCRCAIGLLMPACASSVCDPAGHGSRDLERADALFRCVIVERWNGAAVLRLVVVRGRGFRACVMRGFDSCRVSP
jgi:hypothetical protein